MTLGPADIFDSVNDGGGYGILLIGKDSVVAHMVDVFNSGDTASARPVSHD